MHCVTGYNDKVNSLLWLTVTGMEKSLFPVVPAFPAADRQSWGQLQSSEGLSYAHLLMISRFLSPITLQFSEITCSFKILCYRDYYEEHPLSIYECICISLLACQLRTLEVAQGSVA